RATRRAPSRGSRRTPLRRRTRRRSDRRRAGRRAPAEWHPTGGRRSREPRPRRRQATPRRGGAGGHDGALCPTPDTEAHLRPVASRPCRQRADVCGRSCFAARELPQRRAIPAELGMRLPRLLALRDAAIEAPVGPERLYYLVEIVGQTKNAPCGQIGPALLEVVQDGRRPW